MVSAVACRAGESIRYAAERASPHGRGALSRSQARWVRGHYVVDMAPAFDQAWAEAVCAVCDPVCESANVGFVRQILTQPSGGVSALLWEAEPLLFADRYPDSRIIEAYGPDWPPHCVDYWIYINAESREARFSVEGLEPDNDLVQLTGDGLQDGPTLARVLAQILRVAAPGP